MSTTGEQSGDLSEGLVTETRPLGVTPLLDLSKVSSGVLDGFGQLSRRERDAVASVLETMSHACAVKGSFFDSFGLMKLKESLSEESAAEALILDPYLWPKKLSSRQALEVCRGILWRISSIDIGRALVEHDTLRDFGGVKEAFKAAISGNRSAVEMIARNLDWLYSDCGGGRDCLSFSRSLQYVRACLGSKEAMYEVADILSQIRKTGYAKHHLDGVALRAAEDGWRYVSWSEPRQELDREAEESYLGHMECDFLADDLREVFNSQVFGEWFIDRRPIKHQSTIDEMLADVVSGDVAHGKYDPISGIYVQDVPNQTPVHEVTAEQPVMSVLRGVDGNVGLADPNFEGGRFRKLMGPLPVIQAADPDHVYGQLMKEFPWMAEANEIVGLACATSSRDDLRVMRVPPILLVGPSGAGKSRWSRRVAELLGVYHHRSNMAGGQSSMEVVGSAHGWSNARPSLPVVVFGASGIANPMLLLDEIDKTQSGMNGDAVDGLLPMLEEETASSYSDICLLASFDLTKISFVFTANSESGLGTPFLDRVKLVQTRKPTPDQFEAALPGILAGEARKLKIDDWDSDPELASKVMGVYRNGGSIQSAISAAESELTALIWRPKGKGGHLRLV